MKVNMFGMDMEMTPQEFKEMVDLLGAVKDPKEMTFDEELELLGKLKYFEIVETEVSSFCGIKVILKGDLG